MRVDLSLREMDTKNEMAYFGAPISDYTQHVEMSVEEEGLTLVLTPPQLAAVLANGTLEEPSVSNRAWGSAAAIFGALEVFGGGALLLIPEPTMLTKLSGGALGLHGMDTFQAGVRQAWTGRRTDTLTSDGTTTLAQLLGVDEDTAKRIGHGVDIVVPLFVAGALAAARIAAVRAGKISLAGHEAQGGHTIAKHVGQTEAQLRARLVAQPKIPTASSFETLAQAERVVSGGLHANRTAIAQWAETAAPNAKRAFDWTASGKIGHGVIRATGQLTPMSKVRIVLQKKAFQGKLYYILTAFPIP